MQEQAKCMIGDIPESIRPGLHLHELKQCLKPCHYLKIHQIENPGMTDKELIEGVIKRDRNAIRILVDTYQERVIKTAYYFLGNMEDAEDLSQEIFLEILNSIHKFRQASAMSTWVYRIIVNRSMNAVKRNNRRQIFQRIGNYLQLSTHIIEGIKNEGGKDINSIDEKENRDLLQKAIDTLPENQRIVFVLNKYEDMSYKEISEITGHSLSAVDSLIYRAKQNLQKKLFKHFSEYSKK